MANTQVHLQGLATACPICEGTAFFASTEQPASDDVICCGGCGGRYTYGFLSRRTTAGNDEKHPGKEATSARDEQRSQEVSAKADRPRNEPAPSTAYLVQEIAKAAYFRAQNRGFAPGHEQQDWFEAQSTVLRTESRPESEP
jgi:DUF2934 family protein